MSHGSSKYERGYCVFLIPAKIVSSQCSLAVAGGVRHGHRGNQGCRNRVEYWGLVPCISLWPFPVLRCQPTSCLVNGYFVGVPGVCLPGAAVASGS